MTGCRLTRASSCRILTRPERDWGQHADASQLCIACSVLHSLAVVVVDVVVGVVKYLQTDKNTDTDTDTHIDTFTSNHKELAPDTNTGTYTYTHSGSSIPKAFKLLRFSIKAH